MKYKWVIIGLICGFGSAMLFRGTLINPPVVGQILGIVALTVFAYYQLKKRDKLAVIALIAGLLLSLLF